MAVGHWTVDNYFTFSVTNDSNNDTWSMILMVTMLVIGQ